MSIAAFFDLDRTLIAGSSSQVFSQVLNDVGIETPSVPGQSLFFKLYELFGEDPISMRLARQGARLFSGHRVATVQAAGLMAADVLATHVPAHARTEIARHRAAGTSLVMATTSPYDLVWPLAQALGFDELICTRYCSDGGVYDGSTDGDFVWGPQKAAAVAAWAGQHAVDLTESFAYSDSFYDVPMLELVGNPVAVNPDMRLRTLATARRWQIRDFDRPEGVPSLAGIEGQELLFGLFNPRLSIFADIELAGLANLPDDGPVIIAANHRSYFDPLALAYVAAESGRPLRFMAKKEVVDAPVLGTIISALGTIRVDRGSGSTEPMDAAAAALVSGEAVVILPQATIPRGHDFFKAKLVGRTGAVRLAQMTGAPIVPVGIWGSEQVWPRSAKLPKIDIIGERPTVHVNIGNPYTITKRSKPEPQTTKLMSKIVDLLPPEAHVDQVPSEEDLARTQPS